MKSLQALLTSARIRSLASSVTIQRGQDYYARGHVQSISNIPAGIRGYILGQRAYAVELSASGKNLEYHCTCPMGEQGDFCKHCVAVAIAFLNDPPPEDVFPVGEIRARLTAEPPARVIEMILEWAAEDEMLQNRLLEYHASFAGPDAVLSQHRRTLLKAIREKADDLASYAEAIHLALDPIEERLSTAPEPVMELCEEAAKAIIAANHEDDLADEDLDVVVDRIEDMHLEAAGRANANPVKLAERLFQLETGSSFGMFSFAPEVYKDVLGPDGLAAYRNLAENASFTRAQQRDDILESIARATGKLEDLIAVYARDLSTSGRFARIIVACRQAGNDPLALTWAERGHKLYPASTELREALAEEYHQANRSQDALKLIWKAYAESPGLPLYEVLKRHAERANDWPEHRDRALGLIRSKIAASKGKHDHSALVEILLAENNPEDAWREAQAAGCASHLWLQLAEAREKKYPGDAAPIFLKRADEELARIRNSNYDAPIALLLRAAKLMKKIGALPHFHRHLDSLREQHKSKRKFIDLLNHHRAKLEDGK